MSCMELITSQHPDMGAGLSSLKMSNKSFDGHTFTQHSMALHEERLTSAPLSSGFKLQKGVRSP